MNNQNHLKPEDLAHERLFWSVEIIGVIGALCLIIQAVNGIKRGGDLGLTFQIEQTEKAREDCAQIRKKTATINQLQGPSGKPCFWFDSQDRVIYGVTPWPQGEQVW